MDYKAIEEFLGVAPNEEGVVLPEKHIFFYYQSEKINYAIFLDVEEKTLSVGAGFTEPFGHDSIFEVVVEWDRADIETEPQFYGDQPILVFRKDYPEYTNYKTLMVMRWSNGELSVWPSQYPRSKANEN